MSASYDEHAMTDNHDAEDASATEGRGSDELAISPATLRGGIDGLMHGLDAPESDAADIETTDFRRISESSELAHARNGLYTSRAVPEIVLTEDEARTVAKVLAMYVDSGAYTIGRDEEGIGIADDRDFKKVLSGMMNDLVPVMPKAEHEELARRELLAKAQREVERNYRPVDHLVPCDPKYVPFTSYPVEIKNGSLARGIPGATGWEGVPFADAARDGRHRYMPDTPVWDYLPEPFATHEDVPISLTVGKYRLNAIINCGISPVPGATVKDDYDYDKMVETVAPAIPRVERVRLVSATRDGAPVDIGDGFPHDDGDFDAFRHDIDEWLAQQEQHGRPVFANSKMERNGRAFMRLCVERSRREREEAERSRRWREQQAAKDVQKARERAERMSRYGH